MDIHFVQMFISIQLVSNIPDRYLLFRMRNPFQAAFRETVDCTGSTCEECYSSDCPYLLAFSQRLSPDPSAVKRYQKPPLPFVFDMPVLPPIPNAGNTAEVGLVLVGRAVNHARTYISSVEVMLEAVGARIAKVETAGYDGVRYPLVLSASSDVHEVSILSSQGLESTEGAHGRELTVSVVSPLRLIHDGKPVRNMTPAQFLRALMRRVSAIAFYYGDAELDVDFKWLSRLSSAIRWSQRDFRWSDWSRHVSGIIGNGTLVGDLDAFQPFLLLGGYLHLGKNASFGMGKLTMGETPGFPARTSPRAGL